ncbi:MAG: chitobiase/beta-hexosaminidase C-terminal domain-containing protein [Bacteroidales bacterium]|nr:chitobiase/beta-hexosaminidase C-terminal domain-containing protein [Bacteroidales bacterium]
MNKTTLTTCISACLLAMASNIQAEDNIQFEKYTGALVEGDYLIVDNDAKAMMASVTNGRFDMADVAVANNIITTSDGSIIWHIAQSDGDWTIYNDDVKKYAAVTGNKTSNMNTFSETVTEKSKWEVSDTYIFTSKHNKEAGNNSILRRNKEVGFSCYASGSVSLFKKCDAFAPTFNIPDTIYAYSIEVEMSAIEGWEIKYTIDGSDPTAESTLYQGSINLTQTTVIKAIAINGEVQSSIAALTVTRAEPTPLSGIQSHSTDVPCLVEGEVAAITSDAFVVRDNTSFVYCTKASHGYSVGTQLSIFGYLKQSNGKKTFDKKATYNEITLDDLDPLSPETADKQYMTDWLQQTDIKYITTEGKLKKEDSKNVLEVTGLESAKCIILQPKSATILNNYIDKYVSINAFLVYVQSGTNIYMVLTDIQESTQPTGVGTLKAGTPTDDILYNLQGQKVGPDYKGIVIKGGKLEIR